MRLIDTDETIKQYTQIFVEKYGIECGEMFQGVLKQMPTAYDVDKVLEQLEYSRVPNTGIAGYHKVVEIVKGGGIDGVHIRN